MTYEKMEKLIKETYKDLTDILSYFHYHNKNLTKQQDIQLIVLQDVVDKIEELLGWK